VEDWIKTLFASPDLLKMGHLQRAADHNLGLGWLYYGLTRVLRPDRVVVIGSYRGFTPLVFGRALSENLESGEVIFIDPSWVDDFWRDPQAVRAYFESFGVCNIRHYLMTTQQFVESEAYRGLENVGIVFIDGHHTEEQAEFDFLAFEPLLETSGMVLFHDSAKIRKSKIYGTDHTYERTVKRLTDRLEQRPDLQVLDLPFGSGVTLVRRKGPP
jgi:predicted O-methyltransferase YrrM